MKCGAVPFPGSELPNANPTSDSSHQFKKLLSETKQKKQIGIISYQKQPVSIKPRKNEDRLKKKSVVFKTDWHNKSFVLLHFERVLLKLDGAHRLRGEGGC